MGKEEHTIALLEGFVIGNIDYNVLQSAVDASDSYENPEEALSLYKASVSAIELSGLRQDIQKIVSEES